MRKLYALLILLTLIYFQLDTMPLTEYSICVMNTVKTTVTKSN